MRAAQIYDYGDPDVFKVEEVDPPSVGPKDVMIEVHAASVNPIDWKIRKGAQRAVIRYRLPHVLGLDVSGVVTEVGSEVSEFSVGDEVYSSPTHKRSGTYAEYVSIDQGAVAHKPKNMNHQQAASIPLVGLTAYHALVNKARLKSGEKALINAGSGGVGSFAIQLAKALGAHVATTCSTRNLELVTSLGADQAIDYTTTQFEDVLQDYDVVMDNLGFDERKRARTILRRGGRLATIVGGIPQATAKYGSALGLLVATSQILGFVVGSRLLRGVRTYYVLRPSDAGQLTAITRLIEEGKIEAVIDRVFPLEDIAEAHRYSQTGRARGKIIIAVK